MNGSGLSCSEAPLGGEGALLVGGVFRSHRTAQLGVGLLGRGRLNATLVGLLTAAPCVPSQVR